MANPTACKRKQLRSTFASKPAVRGGAGRVHEPIGAVGPHALWAVGRREMATFLELRSKGQGHKKTESGLRPQHPLMQAPLGTPQPGPAPFCKNSLHNQRTPSEPRSYLGFPTLASRIWCSSIPRPRIPDPARNPPWGISGGRFARNLAVPPCLAPGGRENWSFHPAFPLRFL